MPWEIISSPEGTVTFELKSENGAVRMVQYSRDKDIVRLACSIEVAAGKRFVRSMRVTVDEYDALRSEAERILLPSKKET